MKEINIFPLNEQINVYDIFLFIHNLFEICDILGRDGREIFIFFRSRNVFSFGKIVVVQTLLRSRSTSMNILNWGVMGPMRILTGLRPYDRIVLSAKKCWKFSCHSHNALHWNTLDHKLFLKTVFFPRSIFIHLATKKIYIHLINYTIISSIFF